LVRSLPMMSRKRLVNDVTNQTFHDVTDAGCQAQNSSVHGCVYTTEKNVEFKQTKLELTEIPECLKTKSSPIDKARDVFSLWPPIISASTVRYRKTSWYATGEEEKK